MKSPPLKDLLSIVLVLTIAITMTACATLSRFADAPAPVEMADRTMIDEQAMLGVELAYKAARLAAETAVDAGLIKGPGAARVAELDARAYRAVETARRAYRAGNAASFGRALDEAQGTVRDLLALAPAKGE